MTMEQVTEFVTKLGLPISLLLAFLYGGYRLAQWCGLRVDQWVNPLLLQHLSLVKDLNESTKANTEVLKQVATHQWKSNETLHRHTEVLSNLVAQLSAHREKTEDGITRHKTD